VVSGGYSYQNKATNYVKHKVNVKEVIVPVITEIPLFQFQYFPTIPPPAQAPAQAAPAIQPVQQSAPTPHQPNKRQLRDLIKEVITELQADNDETDETEQDDGPPDAGTGLTVLTRPAPLSNSPTVVKAKAVGILNNRCGACHTGATAKGNLKIFTAKNVINVDSAVKAAVLDVVEPTPGKTVAKMPPAAKRDPKAVLPVGERLVLRQWNRLP